MRRPSGQRLRLTIAGHLHMWQNPIRGRKGRFIGEFDISEKLSVQSQHIERRATTIADTLEWLVRVVFKI